MERILMLITRLKPTRLNAPIIIPNQIIFHSAGDNYGVEGHIGWQHSGSLESHAYTARNGDLYQIVQYNRRANANLTANGPRADGTGALSMETGSSINATEPWYDAQIDTMVDWARERIAQFPTILPRRCPSANASGLGYHIMFGTPGPWTPVAKACPGVERIKQFSQVLLPRITKSGPTVIDTKPGKPAKPKEWDEMASKEEIGSIVQKALENPDNMRAAAKTLLAYDIGTGKSLAATLQEIIGQQQQIISALNAPKA